MTDYKELVSNLKPLTDGVPHQIANLANTSALIFTTLPALNWAGFYLEENGILVLGPFQGKPACLEIAPGRGVCGTAYAEDRTVCVENVHEFPGHIACDGASDSEIVIPLHKNGRVIGVLDIDSPVLNRFSAVDQEGLEAVAAIVEGFL